MLLAQQSLRLLACAIIFFVALTSTRPTDDKILARNSLRDQLEKKNPAAAGIEPVTPYDIGFSFDHSDDDHTEYLQERAPVCIASLCCWYDDLRRWVCPARWPTTGDLRRRMVQKGNVGKKVSFFYTRLGAGGAIALAKAWQACHTNYVSDSPGLVAFDSIVDGDYELAQGKALTKIYGIRGVDIFQKLLSQAFAEESAGDVYLFTQAPPYDSLAEDRYTNTWVGWEYPALTRNSKVDRIYRVDPRPGQDQDRILLWQRSDGPSQNEPLGLYNPPARLTQ